tara:strand:- start:104 stop:367 length:264 start_codon:yes stop_codon:yes gene_type:complete
MTRESNNTERNTNEQNERRQRESNGCSGSTDRRGNTFTQSCDTCGEFFRSDTRGGTMQDCGGDHGNDHSQDMRFTAEEWEARYADED